MNHTVCRSRSILCCLVRNTERKRISCRAASLAHQRALSSSSGGGSGDREISDDSFDLNPSQHATNRITKPVMPKRMQEIYNDTYRTKEYSIDTQSDTSYTKRQHRFDNFSGDTGHDLLELETKDPWKLEWRSKSNDKYNSFRKRRNFGQSQHGHRDSRRYNGGEDTREWQRDEGYGMAPEREEENSVIRDMLESSGRLREQNQRRESRRDNKEEKWYNHGLAGPGKKRHAMDFSTKPQVEGEALFGLHPILLALQQGRRECHRLFVKDSLRQSNKPRVVKLLSTAAECGVPVQSCDLGTLDYLSRARVHQGFCLDATRLDYVHMEESGRGFEAQHGGQTARLWLVLDSIQDPMNFGAMLRSAYFLGVDRVCAVKENSCPLSPVVSKASSGVLELRPVYRLDDLTRFLETCRDEGWQIMGTVGNCTAAGGDPRVVSLSDARVTKDTIVILGNEGTGLSSDVTDLCHQLLTIESRHRLDPCVDSLNVSVATGILLHQLVSTIVDETRAGKTTAQTEPIQPDCVDR